jgi:molybdopterin-guanine dinucleotide biosynthesis protein A
MESHRPDRSAVTALILAAGANTRLEGILPPGLKPLLVVNGRTLFKHAIDHANDVWDCERLVAVVSPDNARHLAIVGGADDWVVQPSPDGVVDAIRRGLRVITTPWTLILCADNTFDLDEAALSAIACRRDVAMFGARRLAPDDEHRFTRYYTSYDRVKFVEATNTTQPTEGCWIGPLLLPTEGVRNGSTMPSIVDLVNVATADFQLVPVQMTCADLGIPEAL